MLLETDAMGGVHFVFVRGAVRLHPREGTMSRIDELSEKTPAKLF